MSDAKTHSVRLMMPWDQPSSDARLTALLQHPEIAAVELRGAALADATACRGLVAAIRSAGPGIATGTTPATLPPLVVVDAHAPGVLPEEFRPPDPVHLALDLAAGGEEFEVTLKVLNWARPVAEMGVDLVLSPRLDPSQPPLDDSDLVARLTAAWTEALLAAGLVACAGPWHPDDAWAPFGAALAHGLEAVFVEHGSVSDALADLREQVDSLVVVGPTVGDVAQVIAGAEAGVDLARISGGLAAEEVDTILDAVRSMPGSDATRRVDALREDWLV